VVVFNVSYFLKTKSYIVHWQCMPTRFSDCDAKNVLLFVVWFVLKVISMYMWIMFFMMSCLVSQSCFLLGSLVLCSFAATPHSLPVCYLFLSLTSYFFYWETSSNSVLSSSEGSCQKISILYQDFVWTVMTIFLFAVAVSWLSVFLICCSLDIIKLSTKIPIEGLSVYFLLCERSVHCKAGIVICLGIDADND
jgi:hypothetical protein